MDTEVFFQVIAGPKLLSKRFCNALERELIQQTLPKYHFLLEAPRIADFAYFLQDGFVQSFTFTNGKKSTGDFWRSGQIVVPCNSFFERVPSSETIQLMAKSVVFSISYESVQKLFAKHPDAMHVYRLIMNRYYQNIRNRIFDLQQLDASERLEKLFRTFPDIEQLVTQENIASYLGIAPQSLSRIKRSKGIH